MDKVEYDNILIYSVKVTIRRTFPARINTREGSNGCRLGCRAIRQ